MADDDRLAAEARARVQIDAQLVAAGWVVQDQKATSLFAGQGVAVRESIMAPGHGRADYLLYVDKRAVGVIEAKPQGRTLSGVEWQPAMYAEGLPADVRLKALTVEGRLPFVLEASGTETHLTNGFDPSPRARRIAAVPGPATLARILREAQADPEHPTWRAKVAHLPPLDPAPAALPPMRPAQVTAIEGIERSLAEQRFDRSLVQMATGAGKTFTAVTECYRLLKHGGFHRILFLVDRNNLADQTLAEFQNYRTPDDGRRFTEVYNADKLTGAGALGSSSVVISTIQRVHRVLTGRSAGEDDDPGLDAFVPDAPVDVPYSAAMPPEAFDLVVVDEAHRSIYGVWRGPRQPVGRVGLVTDFAGPSVCSNFMHLMRPRSEAVIPRFLHLLLNDLHERGGTAHLQKASTNIRNVKASEYLNLEVSIPSLEEPRVLVEEVESDLAAAEMMQMAVQQARLRAAELRWALLAAAFSGRLTGRPSDGNLAEKLTASGTPA